MSILDEVFQSVYSPRYTPEEQILADAAPGGGIDEILRNTKEKVEEVEDIFGRLMGLTGGKIGYSRTEEVEELTDEYAQRLNNDIQRIRAKIKVMREEIDADLNSKSESTFVYRFKKKPKVRKALQAVYGQKRNFITYEDYIQALEMKRELEEEDAESFFEDDDE